MLRAFQEGRHAVLVATAVAEEGLDLRQCHLVLRYDLPATPKSFIQSRGRARVRRSRMVLLVRRGDWKDTEKVTRALEYALLLIWSMPAPTSACYYAPPLLWSKLPP